MGWKTKWVKDGIKTLLPFQNQLRAAKRKWKPYSTLPKNDANAFEQGLREIDLLREAGVSMKDTAMLEVGSGWKPIIPMLFSAAGCRPIHFTDQERLMDRQTLLAAAEYVRERADAVAPRVDRSAADVKKHFERDAGSSFDDALRAYDMQYHAPYRIEDLPSSSVDIVISRAVLEHISQKLLEELCVEWRRLLRPNGVMCHVIDNSDHWEHTDKTISRVNFLRFPDAMVPVLGLNVQNFQNRLRHYEYRRIFRVAGFDVLKEIAEVDEGALEAAKTLPLCGRYKDVAPEELAVMTSYFVVRRSSDS